MNTSPRKVKAILVLAISLIAILLISSTALLITITKKRKQILNQEQQITKLESELEYYKNQNSTDGSKDDKENDSDIIIEGAN